MSTKHRGTIAKEILEQTQNHFREQRENITVTSPKMPTPKFEKGNPKKFEPTSSFSEVFSVTVGKKNRPCMNVNLKKNPRLIALSEKKPQESQENETEHITQMSAQGCRQESLRTFEPTSGFFKIFSEVIGKNSHK